jgi:hypothetical protein
VVVTVVTVVTVEVVSPPLVQRHGHCSVTNAPIKALLHCSTVVSSHTEFVSGQSLEAAAVVVAATVVTVVVAPSPAQRHGQLSVTNAPTKALLHCSKVDAGHTEFVSGQSLEAAAVVVGGTVVVAHRHGQVAVTTAPTKALLHCSTVAPDVHRTAVSGHDAIVVCATAARM